MKFEKVLPPVDLNEEIDFIVEFIKDQVRNEYKRDGIVVGLSGGVDSAVTAALSLKAVGEANIISLIMPEKESNPISSSLALEMAEKFNIKHITKDITPVLDGFGAYAARDEIVKRYFPEYDGTQKWKLVQPGSFLEKDSFNFYSLKLETAEGPKSKRLKPRDLRAITGATDLKQRTRMATLYQVAEAENYVVAGTTNLSETALGFYVKYGDGGVDIEPLSYLYKTYVFQIAEHLGVPAGIVERLPSPDTFSAEVADDEFFFRLPYDKLDLFLWAMRDNVPADAVSKTLGVDIDKVSRILGDLKHKQEISGHLRRMPAGPDRRIP
jgi:NAD+ synthase